MSLMNSTEIENIERWLEPTEHHINLEDSPKKLRFEDEKKIEEHDFNFSLIRALKETGLELNLKPRDTNAMQDSFFAIQQLISPTGRKNSQPGFERASVDHGEEKAYTMQLSKFMEALGYTRDARNKTSGREEDSNIHAEVDRILKDLELSLEKVDDVSSDAESEEEDQRILDKWLEDEIFREDRRSIAPQVSTKKEDDQELVNIEYDVPQTNFEMPGKIILEKVSDENKPTENIMIIEQKQEEVKKEMLRDPPTAEIIITEKAVKKVLKLQKKKNKKCMIF